MGLANPGRAILKRGRFTVVPAAIGCTLALAACGSSNQSSGGASTGPSLSASLVKFSACMRSHGVSGFPDPSTKQSPNSIGIDGYNFDLPAGVNPQSPAFESAQQTCGNLIGGGTGTTPNPAILAKAEQAALAHAQCMRQHGVPNFPDPTIRSTGSGIVSSSGGRGIDPRSPAFQQAQKICGTQ
jgi:hypothetical protein